MSGCVRITELCVSSCVQDTGDDAAEGPEAHPQTDQVDVLAVDVGLHVEREQRLHQDVESPHPEGQHRPHQVHGEQRGLLLTHRLGFTSKKDNKTNGKDLLIWFVLKLMTDCRSGNYIWRC